MSFKTEVAKALVSLAEERQKERTPEVRVKEAMDQIGLKVSLPTIKEFLAKQVEDWVAKSERAVNGDDFRNCKAQAQLHTFLFWVVTEQLKKQTAAD